MDWDRDPAPYGCHARRQVGRPQLSVGWAPALALVVSAVVAGCGSGPAPAVTTASPAGSTSPSPAATSPPAAVASSTPFVRSDSEWTTYMGDPGRSGIGPAVPGATNPHRSWTAHVDGEVSAEPLVAGGSVIVATEQDSLYALNPTTGAVRWRTHLGEPIPLDRLQCGNIDPNGITSTPVVDSAAGILYAVAMVDSPPRHELFALHLADGSLAWHRAADPPGASPRLHQQRGSLNLANGRVYFSYGGFAGDCGRYNGWVLAAPADGAGGRLEAWRVPSNIGGAIWAPPGPVISSAGDVWVSSGNTHAGAGGTGGEYDGANSVMHLDPALGAAADRWAPQNWAALNSEDLDLGSLAPALLPEGLVFVSGKDGVGYLLRESRLGGIGGELFAAPICQRGASHGAYGGAAIAAGMVFVPCKDGLTALRVNASAPSFSVVWQAAPGSNTAVLAYGLAWTVAAAKPNGSQDTWSGTLMGLDPSTGAAKAQLPLGGIPHFASPAAAGGNLYVSGLGIVYAVSVA